MEGRPPLGAGEGAAARPPRVGRRRGHRRSRLRRRVRRPARDHRGSSSAVVLLFLVIWPIVVIALELVILVLLFLVSLAGRVVFRRPWTVVARGETPGASRELEWRVVGWRRSGLLIDAAADALAAGRVRGALGARTRARVPVGTGIDAVSAARRVPSGRDDLPVRRRAVGAPRARRPALRAPPARGGRGRARRRAQPLPDRARLPRDAAARARRRGGDLLRRSPARA